MLRRIRLPGFTLLELLVVISIIGILVAIGASSFSVAQKQGRDARRRGDMKAIQNAMEQSFATNATNVYPSGCSNGVSITIGSTTVKDPGGVTYECSRSTDEKNYCACATMDNAGGNAASCSCGAAGCSITGGTSKFCVTNLQ
jgi:prepilin-type N-terminal cleavage/methylation domain-containing protein